MKTINEEIQEAHATIAQKNIEMAGLNASLKQEKERSDALLLNILPAAIAERLKTEPGVIADRFDEVSVLFSDIVGFTPLSERTPPEQLVEMLNAIFSAFDDHAIQHGLEKIKTIGDAYLVVGGLPEARSDHAEAIARMALDMRRVILDFNQRTGNALSIRIGVHSGPVIAGVIGKRKYAYDLWGDTVNTTARMESHGIAGQIQVSRETCQRLSSRFELAPRGLIEVKGKGEMSTWLLLSEKEAP